MSTKLNLASRPFSNRTLPWVIVALVTFISLVSLVFIVRNTRLANGQAAAVQNDINVLKQQELALRKEADVVRGSFTPQQLQNLSAAHTLVDRKRFSWSRLFADLESVLPGDARVKRIAVRGVTTRGDETLAELEFVVIAKTPNVVTAMIADMEKSGMMQAELRSQNLQRGRGETGAEYELFVVYRPRAGAPSGPTTIASAGASQIVRGVNQ